MPPKKELYRYGGEMFAKFDDGTVHYQDAFGRTEKQHDILKKPARANSYGLRTFAAAGMEEISGSAAKTSQSSYGRAGPSAASANAT